MWKIIFVKYRPVGGQRGSSSSSVVQTSAFKVKALEVGIDACRKMPKFSKLLL